MKDEDIVDNNIECLRDGSMRACDLKRQEEMTTQSPDQSLSQSQREPPKFRFTTDPGSALLYYGDEFVAKFSSEHKSALLAVLVANELMREEIDGVTNHVGAATLKEAFDVLVRTKAQDEDKIEEMFNRNKELGRDNAQLKRELAEATEKFSYEQTSRILVEDRLEIYEKDRGHHIHEEARLQAELLALSATCQRQKDALRNITKHQTPMGSSFNQWHEEICQIAFEALAETPDVSMLDRWSEAEELLGATIGGKTPLSYILEQFQATEGHRPIIEFFDKLNKARILLSTLQPDHQK